MVLGSHVGLCLTSRVFLEKSLLGKNEKNDQKSLKNRALGLPCKILSCLKLVQNKSVTGTVTFCKKYVSGEILIHRLKARMLLPNQTAEFFNHQNILKVSIVV